MFFPSKYFTQAKISNTMVAQYWTRGWILSVWLILLPACAVVRPSIPQPQAMDSPSQQTTRQSSLLEGNYWWYVKVKITWPEDQPIAWHVDELLAEQIFKPILYDYAQDIALWRFHRRAGRDSAGHRFSFIFYSNEATATAILTTAAANPNTKNP